ncbi:head-tail connector protein [Serratia fonticola]|uniref:head-tail connector protein n=1 Tax=Serratia fonticola TaxID=47917 RepID=UPI001C530C99
MIILTLTEVKAQLMLEESFTERDAHIKTLVMAAQRSIERSYNCTLVASPEELEALPAGVRGFVADEDIKLAAKMMVSRWYLDPVGANTEADTPARLGVEFLLFDLMEHTV